MNRARVKKGAVLLLSIVAKSGRSKTSGCDRKERVLLRLRRGEYRERRKWLFSQVRIENQGEDLFFLEGIDLKML